MNTTLTDIQTSSGSYSGRMDIFLHCVYVGVHVCVRACVYVLVIEMFITIIRVYMWLTCVGTSHETVLSRFLRVYNN